MPGALHMFNTLILQITTRNEHNYTNFTNKETKAQIAKTTCKNTSSKKQKWDMTPEDLFCKVRKGEKERTDTVTPKLYFRGFKRCKPCSLVLCLSRRDRQFPNSADN